MSTPQYDEAELTRRAKMAYVYIKAALKTMNGEPLPENIFTLSGEIDLFWEDPDTKHHALASLLAKDQELAQMLADHPLFKPAA